MSHGYNQAIFNCTTTVQPCHLRITAGFYRSTSKRVEAPFLGFSGKSQASGESHQVLIQVYNKNEKSNLKNPHLSALGTRSGTRGGTRGGTRSGTSGGTRIGTRDGSRGCTKGDTRGGTSSGTKGDSKGCY